MEGTGTSKTRTVTLLNVVLNKIKYEPPVFVEIVKILESEPSLRNRANELVHCYQRKCVYHAQMVQSNLDYPNLDYLNPIQIEISPTFRTACIKIPTSGLQCFVVS